MSNDATIPYTLSFRYQDEGDGTRVAWHQEMESLKGVFKFADPIVLKLYTRDVRSNLENVGVTTLIQVNGIGVCGSE